MKIIYIYFLPLNPKWVKDFFMEEVALDGFAREYWDLSEFLFPGKTFDGSVSKNYVWKIMGYKHLEKKMQAHQKERCVYVVMFPLDWSVFKLHRLLTKYRCYTVFFDRSGIPLFSAKQTKLRRLYNAYLNIAKENKLKPMFAYVRWRLFLKKGLLKKYDLVFAPGSVIQDRYENISKVVHFNHYDHDAFKTVADMNDRLINSKYCVFLDDDLAYSRDFSISGLKAVQPAIYFKALTVFFDRMEKMLDTKIVIAAHPHSNYRNNEFGNREIIKGKTSMLVRDCDLAFAHYSTSISFSVLFEKPIVFLYTKEMMDKAYFKTIQNLSRLLDAGIVNINSGRSDSVEIRPVNTKAYNRYKYQYLTSRETENETAKTIFLKTLNELDPLI